MEIPSICEEFSKEFSEELKISFFTSISEAPPWMISRTDILYSNSVLQYFEDHSTFSKLVSYLSPKYILLDDFQTSTGEAFYTLQNYHGARIPYYLSNLVDILKTCGDLGYELLVNYDYASPIAPTMETQLESTGDLSYGIGGSLSLLFKKVS